MPSEDHVQPEEELHAYEEVLEDYRRRQMVEHLTGPMISLVVHVVAVVACALLLVGQRVTDTASVEYDIRELEVKTPEKEQLDELDKMPEEIPDEAVPRRDPPKVNTENLTNQETKDLSDVMANVDAFDVSAMMDVEASPSPLQISGAFGNRSKGKREEALKDYSYGKGALTERAVLKALLWLKEHQSEDGHWAPKHQEAMTGLGLLTFLAHGETPQSDEFGVTVRKAIQWLVNHMLEKKGHGRGYSHGIATYALCEAYALTNKLPVIKPAMERGLRMIVNGQQPRGGWNYKYAKGDRWDLSVSGWQIQALKAGYAAGAQVEGIEKAIEKSIEFVKNVTYKDGKFGYSSAGSGSGAMQGAGTLALQLLGEGDSPEAEAGVENISENHPVVWNEDKEHRLHRHPSYDWYYNTQAVFHGGMRYFRDWNKHFAPILVKNQKPDGHWECPGGSKQIGAFDPYYSTTLNALTLQVYYRYLPTYQEPEKIVKKESLFELEEDELGPVVD